MKKRFVSVCLLLCLIPCFIIPVFSAKPPPVADNEALLTEEEENVLLSQISDLKTNYAIDIVVLTTDSYNGSSAQEYADHYYDFLDCEEDGVLFLLSLSNREWYISTSGILIYALSDNALRQLGEGSAQYFGEGRYFDGFCFFLDSLPFYLDAFLDGSSVVGEETVYYEKSNSPNLLLSMLIGISASSVILLIMRSSMNTKRKQHNAGGYMNADSYRLTDQRDIFLYSNVSKVRKQQNTSTGGRGSSVHHSSGGRRHGGGGGRF